MTLSELHANSESLSRQRDAANSSNGIKLPPPNIEKGDATVHWSTMGYQWMRS